MSRKKTYPIPDVNKTFFMAMLFLEDLWGMWYI